MNDGYFNPSTVTIYYSISYAIVKLKIKRLFICFSSLAIYHFTMKTNEIKKGARIKLRNGWEADMADNMKGNTRMAKVYGFETEIGSVYAHDIVAVKVANEWVTVEHTPAQIKLRGSVGVFGF